MQVMTNRRKDATAATWIYFDEIHVLLKDPMSSNFLYDGEYEPAPDHRDQPLQHHRAVTASRGGPWEDRPAREKTARCFQRKSKAVCFCWKQTAFATLRLPCTPESVSQQ